MAGMFLDGDIHAILPHPLFMFSAPSYLHVINAFFNELEFVAEVFVFFVLFRNLAIRVHDRGVVSPA